MDSIFSTSTDFLDFSCYYKARHTTIAEPSWRWTVTQIILFLAIIIVFAFQMKIVINVIKMKSEDELTALLCKH